MNRTILRLIGLLWLCTVETALSQPVRSRQLQLNDPVPVRRLTDFTRLTKAKWLAIYVRADAVDQSYTYYIRPI